MRCPLFVSTLQAGPAKTWPLTLFARRGVCVAEQRSGARSGGAA